MLIKLHRRELYTSSISAAVVAPLFVDPEPRVLIGLDNGIILVKDVQFRPTSHPSLEVKGGAILSLYPCDIAMFGSTSLISGDSDGLVSVFSDDELFADVTLDTPILAVTVSPNGTGEKRIVCGDSQGTVTLYVPTQMGAMLRRTSLKAITAGLTPSTVPLTISPAVSHIVPIVGPSQAACVLVADTFGRLHLFVVEPWEHVQTWRAPCPIGAIGTFPSDKMKHCHDVQSSCLVACDDGHIYHFDCCQGTFHSFAHLAYQITSLSILPGAHLADDRNWQVAVGGVFPGFYILTQKGEQTHFPLGDNVFSLSWTLRQRSRLDRIWLLAATEDNDVCLFDVSDL
jgi:hypothetical protein